MASKKKTLLMIGNAHIDPVWLWRWDDGFQEVKATFRSALDRMSEDPDFVFTCSSAAYYEWIEKSDPAMFAEIRQRVEEGRWQLAGGWWIQPDCNIPGGESFVRQGLYGQRYFKQKLGTTAKVGYNVDSFGHHGMLPQILKKSGLMGYIFMRPSAHEKGLPGNLFWWESDDGSRVLTFRILYEYTSWGKGLERHIHRCAEALRPPFTEAMCFYGVGNHGGGPTKENLESIRRLDQDPDYPRLVFATPEQLFEDALAQNLPIPVVHDDLQHHASGCYAVHSAVKRWNRQAENLLMAAEKFSALAAWTTGQPYPAAELTQAWKDVLFNQFHDILAGTSIEPAYEDARNLYGEALAIGGRSLNYAVQSLAWDIRIPHEEGSRPIVVFNPHSWPTRINVETEFGRLQEADTLVDDENQPVAMQTVQSTAAARGRNRLSFLADLPPMGYRVYRVAARPDTEPFPGMTADDSSAENSYLRLQINPETGCIKSLFDKRKGIEVFLGEAARPVVIEDPSDTWSHNIYRYDRVIGAFTPASVRLAEHGPVKSVIRVHSQYGASRLIQDFTLYRELAQVDVHVRVDWHEQFKMLKLRFPTNLSFMKVTYEIPYGRIERFANGEEEPGQSWLDVSGECRDTGDLYGVSILNDGKYSSDVNLRDIGLTVLRSPIYAYHIPFQPRPEAEYSFIDQGVQEFNYCIVPHEGSWEQAGTVRRAAELNQPAVPVFGAFHASGRLPLCDSYLSVDAPNVVVSVLKQAEDGEELVLRAYETDEAETEVTIHLPKWGRAIRARFCPCEIKTFRIPRDPAKPVQETDLLEWAA